MKVTSIEKVMHKTASRIVKYFFRQAWVELTIPAFGANHKDLLVIVCDPKTDIMTAMHGGRVAMANIKSVEGTKANLVKQVITHSRFKTRIDEFIASLAEFLNVSLKDGNNFYWFIGGAIKAISEKGRKSVTNTTTSP